MDPRCLLPLVGMRAARLRISSTDKRSLPKPLCVQAKSTALLASTAKVIVMDKRFLFP
jgi:hypothetical protein